MSLAVYTPDELLGSLVPPALIPVDGIPCGPEDTFVLCGGFEDRTSACLKKIVAEGRRCMVILIDYTPRIHENRADELVTECERSGLPVARLAYDREHPAGFGRTFLNTLEQRYGTLFLDISGMSRLLIVQLLVAIGGRVGGFENSFVCYTEAEAYPPTEVEANAELSKAEDDPTFSVLFLSSGVFEISILPELSSVAIASAQSRLVAFPSLDAHHLTALMAELQPSRYSFIEGIPPNAKNTWRKTLIARLNRLDQIREQERLEASTLDYRDSLACLLRIYAMHSIRDVLLVSPTGSKMQTVAVGIFRAFVRDVQIVYPCPAGFTSPSCYTQGIGTSHLLNLSAFGAP